MSGQADARRFTAAEGCGLMRRAFVAVGLPAADAEAVAERMILADLRGIGSHGIARLATYVERIQAGAINPRPAIRTITESDATALVDGDNGMGHLVMSHAAELAIAKAAKSGTGWVGVRGSNHAGAGAVYAMMPLAQDMIGVYLAVASNNHMAPWGGIETLLGTNPIAVAVPTFEEPPVVLDIATTATSFGRIKVAAQNGDPLPEGLVIDRDGKPITDARRAGEGALLPMGGYKGYGLSLVFSLLAGALNGTPVGRDAVGGDDARPSNTGQAIMALNVARFGPVDAFKRQIVRILRELRSSRPLPGGAAVRFPGERGHRTMSERRAAGIPIRPALHAELDRLATTLGIAPLVVS
jgi:LDH2 family malate/lactate/ureidoglycolate dehydrogenase